MSSVQKAKVKMLGRALAESKQREEQLHQSLSDELEGRKKPNTSKTMVVQDQGSIEEIHATDGTLERVIYRGPKKRPLPRDFIKEELNETNSPPGWKSREIDFESNASNAFYHALRAHRLSSLGRCTMTLGRPVESDLATTCHSGKCGMRDTGHSSKSGMRNTAQTVPFLECRQWMSTPELSPQMARGITPAPSIRCKGPSPHTRRCATSSPESSGVPVRCTKLMKSPWSPVRFRRLHPMMPPPRFPIHHPPVNIDVFSAPLFP